MRVHAFAAALAALTIAGSAAAQTGPDTTQATTTTVTTGAPEKASLVPQSVIQRIRHQDQRGINVFEAPKNDVIPFDGFRLDFGAAFTQQFQDLSHSNTSTAVMAGTVNTNQLIGIGAGFNNAVANLYVNAQLAPGIRVAMTSYLSSRHHNETWVKDGYILVDESPIDLAILNSIMKYTTLRVGHFEINYGDSHFRRTDNGNAMYNPFVGNLIMDAFTTEVGGEVYVRRNGLMAMAGVTGGEVKGQVTAPEKRAPSFIGKLGFDKQILPGVRTRLTGSVYTTEKSASNTLFSGDRAGSRYYSVLENTTSVEASQFRSGMFVPGFSSKITAFQINPFVKVGGLEAFGVIESAKGRSATETTERSVKQLSADVVYRFLAGEKLYVAGRHNTVSGRLPGVAFAAKDVKVQRQQLSAGWFITPLMMLKAEYVTQKYLDFPGTDIRNGGKFNGFVMEGVVAF